MDIVYNYFSINFSYVHPSSTKLYCSSNRNINKSLECINVHYIFEENNGIFTIPLFRSTHFALNMSNEVTIL
jgi:hypothetical protein